ncbi:MAG: G5 domain-containing protein [Candidatus Dojkabacteria bacterium]|jgi:hypothetical protein|nr:G5 domain-containing protein [Candidatus Dojkabacteria bacterium]
MEKESCNKQQNQISLPPLIMLMILGMFLLLLINKSYTLVYAQVEQDKALPTFIYELDQKKERVSQGPKVITIKRGNEVFNIFTTLTDTKEILDQNGISLEKNDSIVLNTKYPIDGSILSIIKTEVLLVENIVDIPYETEIIKTSTLFEGERETVQEGVLGVKTETLLYYYEDGVLVKTELIEEDIQKEPVSAIVKIGTSWYSLEGITIRGYDCPYWYSVVDSGPYNKEEKRWLKFIMYCESGCNAESNKGTYKGLFQWSPYWWRKQFSENIFDGHAQLKHTIAKYRAGESTRASQWPACHARYNREVLKIN